jgi:hypothetical protein
MAIVLSDRLVMDFARDRTGENFRVGAKIAVFLSVTMTAGIFVSTSMTLPLCVKVCRLVPMLCEDRRIGSRDSIGSGQRQRNRSGTNSREANTDHWLDGFFCAAQPFRRACLVGNSLDALLSSPAREPLGNSCSGLQCLMGSYGLTKNREAGRRGNMGLSLLVLRAAKLICWGDGAIHHSS